MLSYYHALLAYLKREDLAHWAEQLAQYDIPKGLDEQRYGDLQRWKLALASLPNIPVDALSLSDCITLSTAIPPSTAQQQQLKQALQALIPWRKGPFTLFNIHIDAEWRSDWKWQRILPHITSLKGRRVLDVGCGNGYHCWRMLEAGAKRVIGIDPSPRFVVQFLMLKHFIDQVSAEEVAVDVLPIGIEALPKDLGYFDTTFSMGVFYHRRSPMDHLRDLKATLKPKGELVLETLIIDGGLGDCFVPEGRYAMMPNVWFLPSAPTLLSWMKKCGFKKTRLVDTNKTSIHEQRRTDWMRFQSLSDFLHPDNPHTTREGHPAPVRSIFMAEA